MLVVSSRFEVSVISSLTVTDIRYNQLDTESATMLANVANEKGISLCGITPDQTKADMQGVPFGNRMGPTDAILLTADLAVRASLTQVLAFPLKRAPAPCVACSFAHHRFSCA